MWYGHDIMAYINKLLNLLKDTYKVMIGNPIKTLMIIAIDFITFIVFALVAGSFQNKILDELMAINNLVSSRLSGVTEASVGKVSEALGMISMDSFNQHYNTFIFLLLLMVLCSTIIYILFQHFNWMKAHWMLKPGAMIGWKQYASRFAVVAVLWVVIFMTVMFFYIKLSLSSIVFTGVSTYGSTTTIFLAVIFFLGFYFTFVGYSIAHKHMLPALLWTHVIEGIKKIHYFLPIFLLFILKAYIVFEIMRYFFFYKNYIMVPLTVILVMPLVAWLRFGFINVMGEEIKSEKKKKTKSRNKKIKRKK